MNKELARTLTTALVQFIDKERPEDTMCCSDTECAGIEKMFEGDKFDIIEAFIQKKLSRLTEWEKEVRHFSDACARRPNYVPSDGEIRNWAAELLSLAREQFIKDGYIIEKIAFHDAVEKVDPEVMKEVSENVDKENELAKKHLEGYIKGREDTLREMKDFIESQYNTTCGTSAGNTSATDGKEHNPSFTD